ncbi:hypothetical protein HK097_000814, partial [Rhizophlyctis rosea]
MVGRGDPDRERAERGHKRNASGGSAVGQLQQQQHQQSPYYQQQQQQGGQFGYGYDANGHPSIPVTDPAYSSSPPRGLDYLGAPVQTFYQSPAQNRSWGQDISNQWRPSDVSPVPTSTVSPANSTAHLLASSPTNPQSKMGGSSSWENRGGYLSRAESKSSMKDAVLAAGAAGG